MIQANELRLNNLVLFDPISRKGTPRIIKVKQLLTKAIIADDNGFDLELFYSSESLLPIPLTHKIFGKCGFSQSFTSDPQEPSPSQIFEIDYFSIHQHKNTENRFFFYNGNTEIEVKSLHQLQNLYFALTGNELNYNPSTKEV